MAEGYAGKDFLLKLGASQGVGTTPYVTVGGMRSTGLSLSVNGIDVTNKSNMPWQTLIEGGTRKMSVSADGVWNDDATLADMQTLAMIGAIRNFQIVTGEGDTWTGTFQIQKFDRQGPHDKEETWSLSLESSGAVTFTAG